MSNQRLGIEERRVRPSREVRSLSSCVLPLTGVCLALLAACGPTRISRTESSAAGSAPLPSAAAGATPSANASGGTGGSAGQASKALESSGSGGTSSAGNGGASGAAGVGGRNAGNLPIPTQLVISGPSDFWHPGTLAEVEGGDADPIVDASTTFQTFDGFGGTFNELSWRYLLLLSESDRAKALQLLFGADGARFVFGRLPIGANEYAADRYTLDMTDGNTPDPQMAKFSIQRDMTERGLIPYVKAALAIRPNLRFLAVPWTPPTWMKTNGDYDGGTMKEDSTTLSAFALYLSRYVQDYGKQGINVEAIAVQREPSFTEKSPSCLWTLNTYTNFVQTFLPETFAAQNIHAQLYLGLMENSTYGSTDAALVDAAMSDSKLIKFFSGFGFEWGMIDQIDRVASSNLPILQTEHLPGNFPWLENARKDKAPNDYAYATESWGLISEWLKAGATAYITKHLVLDSVGQGLSSRLWPQNSLLVVDTATNTLTVTPAFYVFQHFSRFIAPGAKRKATVTQLSAFDVLAFENPDRSVVTVMFNSGAERELTLASGGTKYRFTLPANSFATLFKAAPAPIAR